MRHLIFLALLATACDESELIGPAEGPAHKGGAANAPKGPKSAEGMSGEGMSGEGKTGEGKTGEGTSGETARDTDPWTILATKLSSTQPDAARDVKATLKTRMVRRKVEDQRISRALLGVDQAFTEGCTSPSVDVALQALREVEQGSMEADLTVLTEIFTTAGDDGRARIWDALSPEKVLARTRVAWGRVPDAISPTNTPPSEAGTPGSTGTSSGADLAALRSATRAQLVLEAQALDIGSEIARLTSTVETANPADPASVDAIVADLRRVDAALLAAQSTRVELVREQCSTFAPDAWLGLIESGQVRRFIGALGGMNGLSSGVSDGNPPRTGPAETRGEGGPKPGGQNAGPTPGSHAGQAAPAPGGGSQGAPAPGGGSQGAPTPGGTSGPGTSGQGGGTPPTPPAPGNTGAPSSGGQPPSPSTGQGSSTESPTPPTP